MLAKNNKAFYNYTIYDTYEAGVVLKGTEVKSLMKAHTSLKEAYVLIKNYQAYLFNAHIPWYDHGNIFNVDPTRTRKLLLHKKEIIKLNLLVKQEKYVLVPLNFYLKKNKIKLSFATAKPKKLYDKREDLKLKDLKRKHAKIF
ncbi:SsrA-binding protein SmpB [[Mycoplasma] cavipharyngis]|uniref:SsrA-binding protein SmpB n=1 Tax=[Mycoplasma] cavipharyngis TaxID=92757 RepID=UPI0037047929